MTVNKLKQILCATAGVAALSMASKSRAATQLLTLDLQAVSVTNGTINNAHSVSASAGSVITLNLYAELTNGNATHTDDGVFSIQGSFKSSNGGTLGNFAGDTVGNTPTTTGLASGFVGTGSQRGYAIDSDGDGDSDVGRDVTRGTAVSDSGKTPSNAYFTAVSNAYPTSPTYATGDGTDVTSILLGSESFTVTATGATTALQFIAHDKGSGTVTQKRNQDFVVDGTEYIVDGTGAGVYGAVGSATQSTSGTLGYGADVSVITPEPASLSVFGFSTLALLRRRRRNA